MVIAVILVVVGAVVGVSRSLAKVNDFQRVRISAGSGTIRFKHRGGYIAYYEGPEVTGDEKHIYVVPVTLTNQATGQTLRLHTPYGEHGGEAKKLHYDYNDHEGLAMWQFHISTPGRYHVQIGPVVRGSERGTIAFGTSIASGVVAGGLMIILGVLAFIAGLIVLVIGLIIRSSSRKRMLAGAYGYGPPGYGGPGYGAPGYGAPGYGPGGYPAPGYGGGWSGQPSQPGATPPPPPAPAPPPGAPPPPPPS